MANNNDKQGFLSWGWLEVISRIMEAVIDQGGEHIEHQRGDHEEL
jgi:hypothetical protein